MAKFTIHTISVDIVETQILVKVKYDIRVNDRSTKHEFRLNSRIPPRGSQIMETTEQTMNVNSFPKDVQDGVFTLFKGVVDFLTSEYDTRRMRWEEKCFGVSAKKLETGKNKDGTDVLEHEDKKKPVKEIGTDDK